MLTMVSHRQEDRNSVKGSASATRCHVRCKLKNERDLSDSFSFTHQEHCLSCRLAVPGTVKLQFQGDRIWRPLEAHLQLDLT